MFWIYLVIVIALFVAAIGWFGRKRGSAKGAPSGDLDLNIHHTRDRMRGDTHRY